MTQPPLTGITVLSLEHAIAAPLCTRGKSWENPGTPTYDEGEILEILGHPPMTKDPRFAGKAARSRNRDELRELILAAFENLDSATVTGRLDAAGIAWADVNDMAGVWEHLQLEALERFIEVGSPAGPITALKPPGNNNSYEPEISPIPAVGEHTENILREMGYSNAEIKDLAGEKVI